MVLITTFVFWTKLKIETLCGALLVCNVRVPKSRLEGDENSVDPTPWPVSVTVCEGLDDPKSSVRAPSRGPLVSGSKVIWIEQPAALIALPQKLFNWKSGGDFTDASCTQP